jgi:hypothetical protein
LLPEQELVIGGNVMFSCKLIMYVQYHHSHFYKHDDSFYFI